MTNPHNNERIKPLSDEEWGKILLDDLKTEYYKDRNIMKIEINQR